MVTASPHRSREDFLEHVDSLIHELEDVRPRLVAPSRLGGAGGAGQASA
jgi:hypothetical protein